MKQIGIASALGAFTAVALLWVSPVVWAITSGMAVGYFAYRFRDETWPAMVWVTKMAGELLCNRVVQIVTTIVLLLLAALWWWGWTPFVLTGKWILYTVITVWVLVAVVYMGAIIGAALVALAKGAFSILGLEVSSLEKASRYDHVNEPFILFGYGLLLVIPTIPFFIMALIARIIYEIYCRERLICLISAGLGAWIGYFLKLSGSGVTTDLIVGTAAGYGFGVGQYLAIVQPIRRLLARS